MSLKYIMLTSSIEVHKGRDMATIDITESYLDTKSYESIIMILKGKLEELLVHIDPDLY